MLIDVELKKENDNLICPVCGNTIEADFGVVTCGRCQAVLFVDMDGNVQVNQVGSEKSEEQFEKRLDEGPGEISNEISRPGTDMDLSFPQAEEQISDAAQFNQLTQVLPSPSLDQSLRSISDEVTEFANSNRNSVGGLSYRLRIEGIDTKEIRTQVERVLADPKMMLDWGELNGEIANGVLELKQINPVKASRLVQKLSDLPVKISWRQSVYDS